MRRHVQVRSHECWTCRQVRARECLSRCRLQAMARKHEGTQGKPVATECTAGWSEIAQALVILIVTSTALWPRRCPKKQ